MNTGMKAKTTKPFTTTTTKPFTDKQVLGSDKNKASQKKVIDCKVLKKADRLQAHNKIRKRNK